MRKGIGTTIGAMAVAAAALSGPGCASVKSALAIDGRGDERQPPIHNPFWDYQFSQKQKPDNIVLRTKKGDRSVEVELPGGHADMTDFVIPVSPAFKDAAGRGPASASGSDDGMLDDMKKDRPPSITDREITHSFKQGSTELEGERRDVETGLGLMPNEDGAPERDVSYLAALDHVKQLYKRARYEAALLEVDELIRQYPTDPKLYEMRGTLLDRIGRAELALRSWNQALRLDPSNEPLRRFIDRKQQKRGVASTP